MSGAEARIWAAAKRLASMQEIQRRMLPLWEDITKYVTPNRGTYGEEEPNQGSSSARRGKDLLDMTPVRALGTLQAGMQSGLTSPSRPWFKLTVSDNELAEAYEVMRWLDDVEEIISDTLARSNFYNCMHGLYGEVAAFGIGAMLLDEDPEHTISCTLLTAGEYFVAFDSRECPEAFGREFYMTNAQLVERFGREAVSDGVRAACDNGNLDGCVRVCHLICPAEQLDRAEGGTQGRRTGRANGRGREEGSDRDKRDKRDKNFGAPLAKRSNVPADEPERPGAAEPAFPYVSLYWEAGKQEALRESGYYDFPVIVPRWDTVSANHYGYGPGWLAVAESKMLQELRRDLLIAQKMMINPPLQAPESARKERVSARPGAVNYAPVDNSYRALYQVNFDIPGQMAQIQESRNQIHSIFYSDIFMMIASQETGRMTATEAMIRNEEKMQMLGPVVERMNHEALDPALSRVYNILARRGDLPPIPPALDDTRVRLEYVSILAMAQKSANLDTIQGFLELTSGLARFDPQVVDKVNADEMIDSFVQNTSMPAAVVRSPEEVAELRAARAQAQAQAQQMQEAQALAQMAGQGAHAAGELAKAPLAGGGSALDGMLEAANMAAEAEL